MFKIETTFVQMRENGKYYNCIVIRIDHVNAYNIVIHLYPSLNEHNLKIN